MLASTDRLWHLWLLVAMCIAVRFRVLLLVATSCIVQLWILKVMLAVWVTVCVTVLIGLLLAVVLCMRLLDLLVRIMSMAGRTCLLTVASIRSDLRR